MKSDKSTYWGPAMKESQYAIFHFDVKPMSMREASDTPLIIDGLDAATAYCRQKIAENPSIGCRIYDCDGKIVQTFSDPEVYQKNHGRPAARRSVIIGTVCSPVSAALPWTHGSSGA